jgi:hypothetical protein
VVLRYIRGFVPWILFAIVSSFGWQWGALVGLIAAVALTATQLRLGLDTLILELSTVLFFAALTAIAFTAPQSPLHDWSGVASMGWLALTAWTGLAAGRPFTTGIARQQTEPELWHHPAFRRTNRVITAVWSAAFTATAIALAVVHLVNAGTAAEIVVQVLGFVLPAIFTGRYPERVRARELARARAEANSVQEIR